MFLNFNFFNIVELCDESEECVAPFLLKIVLIWFYHSAEFVVRQLNQYVELV